MLRFGAVLALFGFGSAVLHFTDVQFRLLSWAEKWQPWLGLIMGGVGALFLLIATLRDKGDAGEQQPQGAYGPPPQQQGAYGPPPGAQPGYPPPPGQGYGTPPSGFGRPGYPPPGPAPIPQQGPQYGPRPPQGPPPPRGPVQDFGPQGGPPFGPQGR